MKIALVHDWINNLSGAERVLIELHKMFPDAPIYTLFQNKKFIEQYLPNAEIRSSFLQKIPGITKNYRYFFFLMPIAIESLNLSEFDLVISSSAIFSKGLVLKPKTKHICYCYSPTRQLWDLNGSQGARGGNQGWGFRIAQHFLRIWDRQASDRVDQFVAISEHVRQRIKKYYRRDAEIIYPPVSNIQHPTSNIQTNYNLQNSKGEFRDKDYYLIVSRLYPNKNIDIAIETFKKLNLPLLIAGTGPEYKKLKVESRKSKVELLGFVLDKDLGAYYQNCKAFIMPQEEDFGITPIEAMFFGKPVLALRKGGAIETVVEGMTGEFFDDPIPEGLADGVRRLNDNYKNYIPQTIKNYSTKFSIENFRKDIFKLTGSL